MANGMNEDEKNLHELFCATNNALKENRLEDARAGIQLFEEEMLHSDANRFYSWSYYSRSMFAGSLLRKAIESAEAEAETKEVA